MALPPFYTLNNSKILAWSPTPAPVTNSSLPKSIVERNMLGINHSNRNSWNRNYDKKVRSAPSPTATIKHSAPPANHAKNTRRRNGLPNDPCVPEERSD
eukprot:CAMPEP_0171293584 /NCGR_PEP_ID=MMETSP0816-20121228/1883_1 /TAXON_ID=420281 /ORGANISM="Proboscia inermis, Strain CCAP1064/1" /LENGTH=98 /DNA_ID=CAMNT_0011764609 /DNA_START=1021 /DNA_END=1318 /DNA_ORIENTATION=+